MQYKKGTKVYIIEDLRDGGATGSYGVYQGRTNRVPILTLDGGGVIYGNQCRWQTLDNGRLLNEERQQNNQVVGKTKTKSRAKNRNFFSYKKLRSR